MIPFYNKRAQFIKTNKQKYKDNKFIKIMKREQKQRGAVINIIINIITFNIYKKKLNLILFYIFLFIKFLFSYIYILIKYNKNKIFIRLRHLLDRKLTKIRNLFL
jgi:predicted Zn-dependent protease